MQDEDVWEWPELNRRGVMDRREKEDQYSRTMRVYEKVKQRILKEAEAENLYNEVCAIMETNKPPINYIKEMSRQVCGIL